MPHLACQVLLVKMSSAFELRYVHPNLLPNMLHIHVKAIFI